MKTISDPPNSIPVFPLPGVLLLPRARLPLNIFENRYLAMIDDALKTEHRLIGMVQPRETPKNKDKPSLQQIGCAGRITTFSETEDGHYMITLSGFSRFRIRDVHEGFTPYVQADIDWSSFFADRGTHVIDARFDRPKFFKTLSKFFTATNFPPIGTTCKKLMKSCSSTPCQCCALLSLLKNKPFSKRLTLQIAGKH